MVSFSGRNGELRFEDTSPRVSWTTWVVGLRFDSDRVMGSAIAFGSPLGPLCDPGDCSEGAVLDARLSRVLLRS